MIYHCGHGDRWIDASGYGAKCPCCLSAEMESLRADAARYHWLRDHYDFASEERVDAARKGHESVGVDGDTHKSAPWTGR